MPPKPKFTREEIIAAALHMVSESGIDVLIAKTLGNALNTSATPIFTVFNSMQEVADGVKVAAMERFESCAHKTGTDMPIFKQIGRHMILFAKEEPQLYQLVFMSQNGDVKSFEDIYAHLGGVAEEWLDAIQKDSVCLARMQKRCLNILGSTPMASRPCALRECAISHRKKYPGC